MLNKTLKEIQSKLSSYNAKITSTDGSSQLSIVFENAGLNPRDTANIIRLTLPACRIKDQSMRKDGTHYFEIEYDILKELNE